MTTLRKWHIHPAPWLAIERLAAGPKGTPRRHYIAAAQSDSVEYVLHARKGWRRFARREKEQ